MNAPNPYAPPKAPVSDVHHSEAMQRPPDVTLAVKLLWISLGLGLLGLFVQADLKGGVLIAVLAMAILVTAIGAWLNVKIATGRNWARITYLILTIVSYGITAATWQDSVAQKSGVFSVIFNVVGAALDLWILYLLFKRSSSDWFRQRPAR